MSKRWLVLIIVAMSLTASLGASLMLVKVEEGVSAPTDGTAAYVISRAGSVISSRNESSGLVEFSSTDAGQAIQRTLNTLPRGATALVEAGEYVLARPIDLPNGTNLMGSGSDTLFRCMNSTGLLIADRSNISVSNLRLVGTGGLLIAGYEVPTHDIQIRDVSITIDSRSEGAFYTLVTDSTVFNVSFVRCIALKCGTNGFINNGKQNGGWVRNISYLECKAIDCGVDARFNDWVVGFDLAERVNIDGMRVIRCEASNNWQSGFHFERLVTVSNAVLQQCVANNNGQAKGAPDQEGYGWGYFLYRDWQHDIYLQGCTGSNNWHGDTNLGPLSLLQG